jgi:DNA-binding FrmR family transcriptional regulator
MKKEIKEKLIKRLSIIEGQVRGLKRMVEGEEYCIDVITQTSAVKNALSSVEDTMLENHLSTHVIDQMREGEVEKVIEEVLSVYKTSKKGK